MNAKTRYINRIQEFFPELVISSVSTNQDGLVNDILVVNEEFVFRFPKNDTWAKELLANEIRVVNLVRKYIDMPIPMFEQPADDFVVYRFIRGKPLLRNDILSLNDAAQDRLAEQLATFLRQFHNIPLNELKKHNIPQSAVNRNSDVWLQLYEDVRHELFPLMMTHAKEWVDKHFEPVLNDREWTNYEPMLVNGDVGPYHILYDKGANRINGIIDFGTAGVGDPAADFTCIIYNYGESFLRQMAKFYPMASKVIDRARFWSGTLELQWALNGIRSKASSWSWFLAHLGSAKDVLPIGNEVKNNHQNNKVGEAH